MSRIRGKDTKPELAVRRMLHAMGYRFRLHRKDLPGRPDIVFPGRRKVIFVHGCFWHQHYGCRHAIIPTTREEYWRPKLAMNVQRDRESTQWLELIGWQLTTVWECQLKADPHRIANDLKAFLGPTKTDKPCVHRALRPHR